MIPGDFRPEMVVFHSSSGAYEQRCSIIEIDDQHLTHQTQYEMQQPLRNVGNHYHRSSARDQKRNGEIEEQDEMMMWLYGEANVSSDHPRKRIAVEKRISCMPMVAENEYIDDQNRDSQDREDESEDYEDRINEDDRILSELDSLDSHHIEFNSYRSNCDNAAAATIISPRITQQTLPKPMVSDSADQEDYNHYQLSKPSYNEETIRPGRINNSNNNAATTFIVNNSSSSNSNHINSYNRTGSVSPKNIEESRWPFQQQPTLHNFQKARVSPQPSARYLESERISQELYTSPSSSPLPPQILPQVFQQLPNYYDRTLPQVPSYSSNEQQLGLKLNDQQNRFQDGFVAATSGQLNSNNQMYQNQHQLYQQQQQYLTAMQQKQYSCNTYSPQSNQSTALTLTSRNSSEQSVQITQDRFRLQSDHSQHQSQQQYYNSAAQSYAPTKFTQFFLGNNNSNCSSAPKAHHDASNNSRQQQPRSPVLSPQAPSPRIDSQCSSVNNYSSQLQMQNKQIYQSNVTSSSSLQSMIVPASQAQHFNRAQQSQQQQNQSMQQQSSIVLRNNSQKSSVQQGEQKTTPAANATFFSIMDNHIKKRPQNQQFNVQSNASSANHASSSSPQETSIQQKEATQSISPMRFNLNISTGAQQRAKAQQTANAKRSESNNNEDLSRQSYYHSAAGATSQIKVSAPVSSSALSSCSSTSQQSLSFYERVYQQAMKEKVQQHQQGRYNHPSNNESQQSQSPNRNASEMAAWVDSKDLKNNTASINEDKRNMKTSTTAMSNQMTSRQLLEVEKQKLSSQRTELQRTVTEMQKNFEELQRTFKKIPSTSNMPQINKNTFKLLVNNKKQKRTSPPAGNQPTSQTSSRKQDVSPRCNGQKSTNRLHDDQQTSDKENGADSLNRKRGDQSGESRERYYTAENLKKSFEMRQNFISQQPPPNQIGSTGTAAAAGQQSLKNLSQLSLHDRSKVWVQYKQEKQDVYFKQLRQQESMQCPFKPRLQSKEKRSDSTSSRSPTPNKTSFNSSKEIKQSYVRQFQQKIEKNCQN